LLDQLLGATAAEFASNTTLRIRLASCAAEHASHWMASIARSKAEQLTTQQYRTAVRHHLDLPLHAHLPAKCTCGLLLEHQPATHIMTCKKTQGTTTLRHTDVAKALEKLCDDAGCLPTRELPVELYMDENRRMKDGGGRDVMENGRADLYVTTHDGDAFLIDVSIVHPISTTNFALDSSSSSKAIAARAREKRRKYAKAAKAVDAVMVPFVGDAYGKLGPDAERFLRLLARYAESHDRCESADDFLHKAYAAISAAIQRGNVRTIGRACMRARNANTFIEQPELAAAQRRVAKRAQQARQRARSR
jgi:hypothetical protein